jgi:hypothetical protein
MAIHNSGKRKVRDSIVYPIGPEGSTTLGIFG